MPFVNTDQPTYQSDQPAFLKSQKRAGFDAFVVACMNGKEISEEKFSELWNNRWTNFCGGNIDESILFLDILVADRLGYTVDLQAIYEQWLTLLEKRLSTGKQVPSALDGKSESLASPQPPKPKPWWRRIYFKAPLLPDGTPLW